MSKNLFDVVNTLQDLDRAFSLGYGHDIGFKIEKFSQFTLAANTLSLASSFNNLNPFLDTPATTYVTSSSNNDVGKKVLIAYIDQNRYIREVEYTLNGQTAVSLGDDKYCVWRMYNNNGEDFVGTIYVGTEPTPSGGVPAASNTYCTIPLTSGNISPANQSLTGIFSIPKGYTGFLTLGHIGAGKGIDLHAAATIRLRGGVFRYTKTLATYEGISTLKLFSRVPEFADIKPLAFSQTGGNGHLDYDILLIKNEYVDRFN